MIRRVKTFRERWMRFWFEPVEPLNLGICRALFFGAFYLFYLPQSFSAWGGVSEVFWVPIALFEILPLLPSGLLVLTEVVWKVSLFTSCLGIFTRASTIISFVLGLYLLGLPQNVGVPYHYDALVVFVLGIMAVSRCGDGFSIDRLISKWWHQGSNPSEQVAEMSGEYTWPVRAVWVMFALIFLAAGVSKLRYAGLEWIFSDHMALVLTRAHYQLLNPLMSWGLYVAQYDWLYQPMAAVTVVLEICYPLALLSRRARWVIVPAVFFMLIVIRMILGPPFYPFMICHLFWIPWDRLSRRLEVLPHRLSLRKLMPYDKKASQPDTTQR